MFVPGKLFQHGLMFAGKAGAYPRVDHLKKWRFTRVGSSLTRKNWTMLEILAMKTILAHCKKFVIYGQKKFCNIGPKGLYRKTFTRAYFQFLYHRPYGYKALLVCYRQKWKAKSLQ